MLTSVDSFVRRLQLALGSDQPPLLEHGIDDLGVDSLIAVDIRSWFLKEMDVDIPVLRILSGITVDELIKEAMVKLTPKLVDSTIRT